MSQPLTGKTAIVTGAAQGIGFAIARRFADAGASVVNTVLPGFVGTGVVTESVGVFEQMIGLPEGSSGGLIGQKQGRLGTVEEVADAVLFLAGDGYSFCTGPGLVLDGGLHASLFSAGRR